MKKDQFLYPFLYIHWLEGSPYRSADERRLSLSELYLHKQRTECGNVRNCQGVSSWTVSTHNANRQNKTYKGQW